MLTADIQIRDPFILKHDGLYFMYGSTDKNIWNSRGTGFDVYTSRDLFEWEGPGPVYRPPADYWGTHEFWAPEVYEYQGAFYMFASFAGEACRRGTAVLRAEQPGGPFIPWSAGPVTPHDWLSLDGTLFVDSSDKPWIIFCHEWIQIKDGTICAAKLSDDLSKAVSEPAELFKSSDAVWSREAFSPGNNVRGYVTDGCFPYTLKSGRLLLIWSCIGEGGYCLGYAVSDSGSLKGPWRQAEAPLFEEDGGHGMIFRTYNEKLMLALHRPNNTPNERAVFIEIEETEDGLKLL